MSQLEPKKYYTLMRENNLDRYQAYATVAMSRGTQGVNFVPTNKDMQRILNTLHNVTNQMEGIVAAKILPTLGFYDGVERSFDIDIVTKKNFNILDFRKALLELGLAANQDSVVLTKTNNAIIAKSEFLPNFTHIRPGVELYFDKAKSQQEIQPILQKINDLGVKYFTAMVDTNKNTQGSLPPTTGVKYQYVPEFLVRYDATNRLAAAGEQAIAFDGASKYEGYFTDSQRFKANMSGVHGIPLSYETEVSFYNQYANKINQKLAGWSGESVQEGVRSAIQWAQESGRLKEPSTIFQTNPLIISNEKRLENLLQNIKNHPDFKDTGMRISINDLITAQEAIVKNKLSPEDKVLLPLTGPEGKKFELSMPVNSFGDIVFHNSKKADPISAQSATIMPRVSAEGGRGER